MKKIYLVIILSLLSFQITYAQAPVIQWQNTIGGSGDEVLYIIQQTSDGGYIVGGYSESGISGDKTEGICGEQDYWIVKLDATGQTIEWQNTIGGSSTDQLYSIQQITDGGYIMGGASGGDYWIVKVDTTGQNVDWDKTIGGSSADYLHAGIHQTADGGYIFGGISWSGISGDKTETNINDSGDYWVIKLDATGQTINWQNSIGGSKEDTMVSLQQTTDGGYILGGYSNSNISGDKTENSIGARDYWVVKLNAEPCINGSIIYNTETGKFNFCEDGVWVEK